MIGYHFISLAHAATDGALIFLNGRWQPLGELGIADVAPELGETDPESELSPDFLRSRRRWTPAAAVLLRTDCNLTLPPVSLAGALTDSTATVVVLVQPVSMCKVRRYASDFGVSATAGYAANARRGEVLARTVCYKGDEIIHDLPQAHAPAQR